MDLDQWITKVKEGQHLAEDELQLLCEYVCLILYPFFLKKAHLQVFLIVAMKFVVIEQK